MWKMNSLNASNEFIFHICYQIIEIKFANTHSLHESNQN